MALPIGSRRALTSKCVHAARERVLVRGEDGRTETGEHDAAERGHPLRAGDDFVPEATKEETRELTWWGDMLDSSVEREDVEAATMDVEEDTSGNKQWRWWWPEW